MAALQVAVIGSGNCGSAIAKIISTNVQKFDTFDNTVKMFEFEETINTQVSFERGTFFFPRLVGEQINNNKNERIKNSNLDSLRSPVADIVETCENADILVFAFPRQFIRQAVETLAGKIKPSAIGLSLITGVDSTPDGIQLISKIIHDKLNIEMSVLMGANIAGEVAEEKFCETTIGSKNPAHGKLLKDVIQTDYFRVVVVDDIPAVELCGAMKNIIACGLGFVDGLGYSDNTKAAVIRVGWMEMIKFSQLFYEGTQMETFFESCGVDDLITTCYGGKNRKVSEAFVTSGKTIEQLEKELLNGQKLQGPETAADINRMLQQKGMQNKFPLFLAVHRICIGEIPPRDFFACIKIKPEPESVVEPGRSPTDAARIVATTFGLSKEKEITLLRVLNDEVDVDPVLVIRPRNTWIAPPNVTMDDVLDDIATWRTIPPARRDHWPGANRWLFHFNDSADIVKCRKYLYVGRPYTFGLNAVMIGLGAHGINSTMFGDAMIINKLNVRSSDVFQYEFFG